MAPVYEEGVTGSVIRFAFAVRLTLHWPSLGFVCSAMWSFGGIVMVLNGEVTNLVEDCDERSYARETHARRIRAATKR